MNKPMTTEELFNRIQSILKEKGRLPDILDYGLATSRPVPVTTCEYELVNKLARGGSEGIYLDIWMEYSASGRMEKNGSQRAFRSSTCGPQNYRQQWTLQFYGKGAVMKGGACRTARRLCAGQCQD